MLSAENHAWFNQQSPKAQAEMNRRFQEYKKCKVVFVDDLKLDYEVKPAEIIFRPDKKKEPFNRARVKREFEKRVREEEEDWTK